MQQVATSWGKCQRYIFQNATSLNPKKFCGILWHPFCSKVYSARSEAPAGSLSLQLLGMVSWCFWGQPKFKPFRSPGVPFDLTDSGFPGAVQIALLNWTCGVAAVVMATLTMLMEH